MMMAMAMMGGSTVAGQRQWQLVVVLLVRDLVELQVEVATLNTSLECTPPSYPGGLSYPWVSVIPLPVPGQNPYPVARVGYLPGTAPEPTVVPTQHKGPPLTEVSLSEQAPVEKRRKRTGKKKAKGNRLVATDLPEAPIPSAGMGMIGGPVLHNNFAVLSDLPVSGLSEWPSNGTQDINFSNIMAEPIQIPLAPASFTDATMVEDSPATFTSPTMKKCSTLSVLRVLDVTDPEDIIKGFPEIFPLEALYEKSMEWDEQWGGIQGHGNCPEQLAHLMGCKEQLPAEWPRYDIKKKGVNTMVKKIVKQLGSSTAETFFNRNFLSKTLLTKHVMPMTVEETFLSLLTATSNELKVEVLEEYDIQAGGEGSGLTVTRQLKKHAKSAKEKELMVTLANIT
ncbi:hypothetical protein EI94DRAFT_1709185 [Lactarius quietus]|nr:hypothetical protein EI94DRAFT_1709185 [Lactarius quietus]